ncbi:MAG: hypothetical protein ACREQ5_04280, partial [Candidatus Dormibacteria bacterium]
AYTSLAATSYSVLIATSTTSLNLAAGQSALIHAVVDVLDTTTNTNIPLYAIAIFNGATFLIGNNAIPSNSRTIDYFIVGPFTGAVSLKSIPLTGTFAVQSYYITVVAQ